MNRVFYIFRHGETDWNKTRRCQGHTNTCLNENGILQARSLSLLMKSIPLDIIITSDLDRAMMTAKIVAEHKQIKLLVDDRLREMSYGVAEGMLFEEAVNTFGSELWSRLQSFKVENDSVGFPEGETRAASRLRFREALLDIADKTPHQVIGVSTHGGAIRNFFHSLLPEDHPILAIPNCVVYKCELIQEEQKFIAYPHPVF